MFEDMRFEVSRNLKKLVEDLPETGPQLVGDAQFLMLSEAFARATGWQLQFHSGCVDDGGERCGASWGWASGV